MCGIFGFLVNQQSKILPVQYEVIANRLFSLSESRGKESSGIAFLTGNTIQVYKQDKPASLLIKDPEYKELFAEYRKSNTENLRSVCFIGHARLVTNGSMGTHENNQPVISSELVGVHNGIIVNDDEIWQKHSELKRSYEVDTEVILALLRANIKHNTLVNSVRKTFIEIKGAASLGILFSDFNYLLLATNTGSIYTCFSADNSSLVFASERFILTQLMKNRMLLKAFGSSQVTQLQAGNGLVVDFQNLDKHYFELGKTDLDTRLNIRKNQNYKIIDKLKSKTVHKKKRKPELGNLNLNPVIDDAKIAAAVGKLSRCTKCLLPETMPFIEFNEEGVCNYCRNYKKVIVQGEAELEEFVSEYRSKSGDADCIATFSGGRDSSFGLHYLKTELKMNPIAYSYDWGMITDLARRNQARMCGQLGIEHILVSADIKKKRENIRRNIRAWFRKPHLGMIPLFMAGDKQYFYYANQVGKQTGIKLIVLCECPYEKTDFKSGFCGIEPRFGERSVYAIPALSKAKLAGYYAGQFISNPAYINPSILDTMSAFFSYYMMPHVFLKLYDYIKWDESTIDNTLINQYDWETANDTNSTWRIGDGTAPFYNYLYYNMAGFTENDTFRSNQIREGIITRAEGLSLVNVENQLRAESFEWYCNTIGIDYKETLRKISELPRLYKF